MDRSSKVAAAGETRAVPRWRRLLVALLVVLGCVVAPISVMGVWIHNTLLNTDQYVATVGPLATNPDVQEAVATRVTNELTQNLDIQRRLESALPSQAAFAVPFIANGLGRFVHDFTLTIVQSQRFAALWRTLNRHAHGQIVALLRGQGSAVKLVRGSVILDLGPIVQSVSTALSKVGISGVSERLKGENRQLVLVSSNTLKDAQLGTRVLDDLAIVLPLLTAALFVSAIALSGARRRTILHSAIGLALAMALMLIAFNLLRSLYLNALPASANQAAATAVYNQLLSFLRMSVRALFAFALIVALAAWLAGPGRLATRVRRDGLNLVRRAPATGLVPRAAAEAIHHYRRPLRIVVIGGGLLVLVALTAPGPETVLFVALVVLVLLATIELLGRVAPEASIAGPGDVEIAEPAAAAPPAIDVGARATRRPGAKLPVPRNSRSGYPDSFYEHVGVVYHELESSGVAAPAQRIADANAVSVPTARRWEKEARRRGLLPPPDGPTKRREAPPAPSRQPASDPIEAIRQLAGLRDDGILTKAEFGAKKAELLAKV